MLTILFLGAAFPAALSAQAQDVTRIGVCNLTLVMQLTWDKTAAARDFVRIRRGILDEFAHLDRELHSLEENSQAQARKDTLASLRPYVSAYKAQRRDWMSRVSTSLKLGPALGEVIGVINKVSQARGYSLVIRSDSAFSLDRIVVATAEADITGDVIDDILARSSE